MHLSKVLIEFVLQRVCLKLTGAYSPLGIVAGCIRVRVLLAQLDLVDKHTRHDGLRWVSV
jgi:hypothetical protein